MILKNNGTIDIALGRSREETRWQNKEMEWSDLVAKVLKTHRTAESYEEYMKLKPIRQDNIKDIGGFVGGIITGGNRKKNSIVSRSMLTLDLDYAPSVADFWESVELFDVAACCYTTHKHSIASPRLRLVIPLSRPVDKDEYEAIARRIAGNMNIEWFDPTTFQPSRLMYWPSTAKDGEFYSNYIDAEWLDADAVLAQYKDWHDMSQWPVSSKAKKKLISSKDKQGDPLTKAGLIGAWCRTYSIEDVIESHLSDVYIRSDQNPDRFTYINGSVSGGLVIYEDKFAFSHHSTDPISEKLVNAFDLVRLHKFAYLDEKHEPDAIGAKLPSFVAMSDYAADDSRTRMTIGQEKLEEAQAVFADGGMPGVVRPTDDGEDTDWIKQMEVDKQGNYLATINNIVLILENDPGLKGCFRMNEFEHRETIARDLPWRKMKGDNDYMDEADDANVRHYMELIYGISNTLKILDALRIVQFRHRYHPVRDYLTSLQWDGKERAETIFIRYLGATASDYIRAVSRKWLLAAVTRIMEPGCKFDEMIVIVGDQGIGKSTILRKLGGKWFSDSLSSIQGKEALEQLQGAWIIEMGELSAMRRAELETTKHFVAKQIDRFRVAYGKRTEHFPRQCVFGGTTNITNFLKDDKNRRFWPITTDMDNAKDNVFARLSKHEVGQVWAEVMGWYDLGEDLHLDPLMKIAAAEIAEEHKEIDERTGALQAYLDTPMPVSWNTMSIYERRAWLQSDSIDEKEEGTIVRNYITAAEVWCELLGGTMRDLTTYNTKDVHALLRRVSGWEFTNKQRRTSLYGTQRVYKRISYEEIGEV